jgi:hypothetical protein
MPENKNKLSRLRCDAVCSGTRGLATELRKTRSHHLDSHTTETYLVVISMPGLEINAEAFTKI